MTQGPPEESSIEQVWGIVGHPQVIRLLENCLRQASLAHAYLLSGPPHVGKRTLATKLAQAVNCESSEAPCNACTSCNRISKGLHADVRVIDVMSGDKRDIGIDQIRDLQMAAHLPPYEGKHKVFVISNVERLSQEAANSLLKTLEEPLTDVMIILLSSKESALLPTIVSRCQLLELKPVPTTVLQDALVKTYGVEPAKARLLSRLSNGCPGWAIQAISDEGLLIERDERLRGIQEVSAGDTLKRLAYAADLAGSLGKNRERVMDILSSWVQWWHDILLVKSGNAQLLTNVDHRDLLQDQASGLDLRQISHFIRHLQSTSRYLDQNANPRLALEVLMLQMPSTGVKAG